MSIISVQNLSFCYDGSYDNVFENVSFQIDTDWKLGFIGRNGRGKTTFLNILMGNLEYQGRISASVNFEYFPYQVADKSQKSIDIINSIIDDYEEWELICELSLLEVDEEVLYRPFETLSNGEQTKLLLATLFLKENSFLLIDEPTNHLDTNARKIVSRYLYSKSSYILVSHDRNFIDECVNHILSINKNNIEVQKGNFSSWYENKTRQDNFEIAENSKLKKEIKRLEKAAKEKAKWSDMAEGKKTGIDPRKVDNKHGYMPTQAAKAKKTMARAKSMEKRMNKSIDEKSKLLKNIDEKERMILKPLAHFKNTIIIADGISIHYSDKKVCEDLSFSINTGDRIALCGKNGSGKSSIIKLIMGENIPYTGRLSKATNLITSYMSQDTSFLNGSLKDFAYQNNIDETIFKSYLRKLNFEKLQFEKDMKNFSEGQKKKVLIAKSLSESAHLYIWDEPFNFIDVISRMQIEEVLLEFKPTILFVEHDSSFVENIATRRVDL